MDQYRIPIKWEVKGYVNTPYGDLKRAVEFALHPDTPLPKEREYVEDSLKVNLGQLYADNYGSFPDSDAAYFQKLMDAAEQNSVAEEK